MIAGKRCLAVVPARGGSRGVPGKNVRPLLGRPLIAHVADAIDGQGWLDRVVVSTDDDEIAAAAMAAGLDAPFRRPANLSGDLVGDVPVLIHALESTERLDGVRYDVVLMLQPTSPLRRPEHVEAVARLVAEAGHDAAWTVSPTDPKYHPLKQLVVRDGVLGLYDPAGGRIIARQQLEPTCHRNGAAYAVARRVLVEQRTLLPGRSAAVMIDEPMVSIDTIEDFAHAERELRAREGDRT